MQLFDKVRPRRTYEEVAARIRRSFVDGSLKPGDRLPGEEELARRFGVSRGALREALRALEVAGVVELRTGRHGGAYISSGKPKVLSSNMVDLLYLQGVTIEQLTEVRIWIEDVVVRAACARATEEDLAALDANIARAKALYDQGRYLEKAVVNIEFHDVLAQAAKNPMLVIVMHTLTEVMTAFVQANGADTGRSTFASRARFMAAMRARDVEAAVEEMRSNLRRVHRLYIGMARERREASPPSKAAPAPDRGGKASPAPDRSGKASRAHRAAEAGKAAARDPAAVAPRKAAPKGRKNPPAARETTARPPNAAAAASEATASAPKAMAPRKAGPARRKGTPAPITASRTRKAPKPPALT